MWILFNNKFKTEDLLLIKVVLNMEWLLCSLVCWPTTPSSLVLFLLQAKNSGMATKLYSHKVIANQQMVSLSSNTFFPWNLWIFLALFFLAQHQSWTPYTHTEVVGYELTKHTFFPVASIFLYAPSIKI